MKNKFSTWIENQYPTGKSQKDRVVIVMRGIPGSGKSYTAKEMLKKHGGGHPHDHIFSTDDFWTQDLRNEIRTKTDAGEDINKPHYDELEKSTYRKNWNHERLGAAHGWNFNRFTTAVDQWMTPLIVDNTNVSAKEMKRYIEYAEKSGYTVNVQEPQSQWWKDHAHMLHDKQTNGTALEDFARFLSGHHQGMTKKYGAGGNTHGVPIDVIRNMIRRWQPGLTADEVMGRTEKEK